jgi:enamine deaminase RidA (YjgF/YER057c/UK114 family)
VVHTGGKAGRQTTSQTRLVTAVREAGGAGVEDVVMFRVYLTRRDDFPAMNEAYAEFLAEHVPSGALPARTTVFVDLPHEVMLVEIDAPAVTG